ncbi:xylan 1,4-beta-xylosidase [Amphibacillus marinus]|uniref:Xylan 1,4-beta-xylosidase n=1 Tax=Amphibacillus marinus TaxID=872970 RepID=A0A1H8K8S9_9BACI|nr:glycoside hydrolase family 43 protein [Amphibacillus marinus]SEN88808.1 xylan 1,4-beta-xylosidase [Amphibacillus marinus]
MKITNPILSGFNPDPSICRAGEDYYIATSTFEWFPGVSIHHSKDLKNWRLVARPLNRVSQLDMKGNPNSGGVWAPQLSYHDGQFWLIYSDIKVTDGRWKDSHNYLTTCTTIDGEWSEPIYMNSSGFDPSLFHNPNDGKKYFVNMVWDHRQDHHNFYGIVLQQYDHEQQKLVGNKEIIFKGTDAKLTEAPHLYYINGYYYLLTAEGGTKFDHQSTLARSKKIEGPYELHPNNPLISSWAHPRITLQKAGHGAILQTHTNEWFFVHLTGRVLPKTADPLLDPRGYCPLGRETAIQRLDWKDDWPYIIGGNYPQDEIEGPEIKEHSFTPEPTKIDFNRESLPLDFQTLRVPLSEQVVSLKARPGYLRISGRESLTSLFTQALVARRWQHFRFIAETKIEFEPTTFQQSAGLVNYYNTENWSYLNITHNEEKGRILDIMVSDNTVFSQPLKGAEITLSAQQTAVYLRVIVNNNDYYYAFSLDGTAWTNIGPVFKSYKLSDDYIQGGGFFTGAFVGMTVQDTSGEQLHADFEYFSYSPSQN